MEINREIDRETAKDRERQKAIERTQRETGRERPEKERGEIEEINRSKEGGRER